MSSTIASTSSSANVRSATLARPLETVWSRMVRLWIEHHAQASALGLQGF